MNRASVSSGSPYEPIVGFARAVRIGNTIAIGGTAPIAPHGTNVGVGDPAVQARRCFEITREALDERGRRRSVFHLCSVHRLDRARGACTRVAPANRRAWSLLGSLVWIYFKGFR